MLFKRPNIVVNVLMPLGIGILLLYSYQTQIRGAAEIGLGAGTSSYFPFVNNYPIHTSNPSLADSILLGWNKRGKKTVYLWQGNSQLHGINQFKPGEINCVKFLFDSLGNVRKEVIGASYPNGNMQEFLVSLIYFCNKFPIEAVIQPIFYDDMREDGIRSEINVPAVISAIKMDSIYFQNVPSVKALKISNELNESSAIDNFSGIHATAQEISERYLDNKLANSWNIWKCRPDIRGNLFNDIYKFRNFALGIKANTIRKIIPGRFTDNYNSFLAMIAFCDDHRIPLIIYIPPLRNDVTPPYDLNEYSKFKAQVKSECEHKNIIFLNLENLVPPKYWGVKESTLMGGAAEIDFMHFQQPGHQLIADTIYKTLREVFSK